MNNESAMAQEECSWNKGTVKMGLTQKKVLGFIERGGWKRRIRTLLSNPIRRIQNIRRRTSSSIRVEEGAVDRKAANG